MRILPAVLALLAVPLIAVADKGTDTKLAAGELAPGTTTLEPIQAGSLTLIPLVAEKVPEQDDAANLMVLDEAMAKKLVRIHEVSEGGSVNELKLTNKGKEPLFLLAGEVIIGGKQDRIIGKNTIIPAKTTQAVPVFCVEHGRWSDDGAKSEFKSAKALAHGRLRTQASFKEQGEVWNEVATKNAARGTSNGTDTYRDTAAQQTDGAIKKDAAKLRKALDKLPEADRARIVGYAVAINGAVASVDMFGSPTLFRKLDEKLVRSYVTEAADVAADAKAKAPTVKDITTFMADADAAEREKQYATDAADTERRTGKVSGKSTVKMKKAKPAKGNATAAEPAPAEDADDAVFSGYTAM
jgi:hypothetical protein